MVVCLLFQVGVVSTRSESKDLIALREERDTFEGLFQSKAEECAELAKKNTVLLAQVHALSVWGEGL